jgi:hypothetical protein
MEDWTQEQSKRVFTDCNHLAGRVISILHGLMRTTIKAMTEDEVLLTARFPSEGFQQNSLHIGQHISARIAADAVLLGTGGLWPGRERWNRWNGRIVLVDPGLYAPMVTVKIQGTSCTLKSTGPVAGQPLRPESWEPVNIAIDPEHVTLVPQSRGMRDRGLADSIQTHAGNRVWLKARIEAVRRAESGCVVSLNIGGARVSALIYGDEETMREWLPGSPVEMHVGQWEAWLRPPGDGLDAIMCKLVYD